ncbi:hypothetical protein QTI66_07700 [Variovorax sp. J22R133]|uniref:hypothetical protein n=1 Tax=Variovorax brevis TaxID=3053503 RepID=UPI002578B978|nr:hypothetical protein [Variovorax sp. J22R133]MDM0112028.1 hypothetical protein [Variovorax sp. J22R133]
MIPPSVSHRERGLLTLFAVLLVIAVVAPALPMPEHFGAAFADRRAWMGLPNAMDVLSNLPFAMFGFSGLLWLHRLGRLRHGARVRPLQHRADHPPDNALHCAWMFFAGLILTAAGSTFYHLEPDEWRLVADRLGMSVAFAGIVGVAVCDRVSARAGWPAAWFMLVAGVLAASTHHGTGNVLPWALVQFGGMAVILALALAKPLRNAVGVRLGWVIACYGLAKLFELGDHAIFDATHELISGHTLKHLAAALAALPVLYALARQTLRYPGAAAVTV